jgi:hypothetical protein
MDDRFTGLLHLLDELRRVGAKLCHGLDLPARLQLWHGGSGVDWLLGAKVADLPSSDGRQDRSNLRRERGEVLRPVATRMEHDHANPDRRNILLILEVPIHGNQDGKVSIEHEPEEPAIALTRPPFVQYVRQV